MFTGCPPPRVFLNGLKVKSMVTKAQLSSEDEKFLQVYLDEFSDR